MLEKLLEDLTAQVARARGAEAETTGAEIWLGIELVESLSDLLAEARAYAVGDLVRSGLSDDEAHERLESGALRGMAALADDAQRAREGLRVLLEELHQRAEPSLRAASAK